MSYALMARMVLAANRVPVVRMGVPLEPPAFVDVTVVLPPQDHHGHEEGRTGPDTRPKLVSVVMERVPRRDESDHRVLAKRSW